MHKLWSSFDAYAAINIDVDLVEEVSCQHIGSVSQVVLEDSHLDELDRTVPWPLDLADSSSCCTPVDE